MEVRQARYFIAIAEQQSMGRAAEALHLTQPALSQALVQLERDLKVDLFQRTSRGMRLTEAGKALVEPARHLVEASRVATSSVQLDIEDISGSLVVAATPAFAAAPMSRWVAQFIDRYPDVDVQMVPYVGEVAIERLLDREGVDLVLAHYDRQPPSSVLTIPIDREEMVLAVPAHEDPFEDGPVHIQELAGRPLVLSPEHTSMHKVVAEAFAEFGMVPTIGVEVSFVDVFIPLTARGVGWSILSREFIEVSGGNGLRVHPLTPAPFRPLSFYTRRQGAPVTVDLFVDLARKLQHLER